MMSLFHCPADVHHGKERENERLEKRCKDHEYEHRDRHQEGNQEQENNENQVFSEDVPEEPHGQ